MAAMNKRRRGMKAVPMADEGESGSESGVEITSPEDSADEGGHVGKKAKTANGAKAKSKGKGAEAKGDQGDHVRSDSEATGEGGAKTKAKGQPGKERDDSPEGGGVAGKDAVKHKNAYEISMSRDAL